MNDENNKIKKLLSDLPIRNKSNFSKAPPHDGATEGHQKSANVTFPTFVDTKCDADDQYEPQQIVKEKTNLFLRYVHSQMELKENKKRMESKRKLNPTSEQSQDPTVSSSKLAKMD